MKHLPNLLTLGNLFCGCIAITYILSAQPYYYIDATTGKPSFDWVFGSEQMYLGSIFIFIAALCDLLDGFTARALKIFSPIGKDLDSLADVISFGVAPSVIMYKLLANAMMEETNAFDIGILGMLPAFLIACFAALRLAKFNITAHTQKSYFIGMPTPAVGLFVATFPLIQFYSPHSIARYLEYKWLLYLIIGLLCWFMVSGIKFIKFIPSRWNIGTIWPQIVLIALTAIAIPFLGVAAFPIAFIIYILLSIVYKQPETTIG